MLDKLFQKIIYLGSYKTAPVVLVKVMSIEDLISKKLTPPS